MRSRLYSLWPAGVAVMAACALGILGLPAAAFAQSPALSLNPTSGPPGTQVTVTGEGWTGPDWASGVPIDLSTVLNPGSEEPLTDGIANPRPDGSGGFKDVKVTIPSTVTSGTVLDFSVLAAEGGHSAANVWFTVTGGQSSQPPATNHPPQIIPPVETFTDGVMVWVRVHYQDPDGDTAGFGFHGAKWSGWAEETHPFSSPSYGRAIPAGIEYPFNHECGRPGQYESDIEFWVYDATGLRSASVIVHLACSTPPVPQPVGTPTQPPLATGDYAALGDSYSSGEGLDSYIDTSKCDRSSLAYGPLLKLDLGTGFVACSGAVTADISNPNHDKTINEPAQIKALSASTNVVTLTIGGDDIGFVQVLKSCVKADNDSALNTDCQSKPPSGSADQKTTLAQAVNARMRALSGGVSDTTPDGIKIDPISTVIKKIHD